MRWPTRVILLLAWLSISAAEDSDLCDEGWIFSDGFCYFFSAADDMVNPKNALQKCLHSDAEYVFPESPEELSFLVSYIKAQNTYGWTVNVERNADNSYSRKQIHTISAETFVRFRPLPDTIPTTQKPNDVDNKCLTLHMRDYYRHRPARLSKEPCDIKLWVVCQAKSSDFPDQVIDFVNWFSQDDLLFWLSGKLASKAEAETVCKQNSMELIYNFDELLAGLNGSYDATPWWLGLTFDQGELKTDNGAKVAFKNYYWVDVRRNTKSQLALLHSGKARYIPWYSDATGALPYICKRRALVKGVYGCPNHWIRGGRSCYSLIISGLTWFKAKESCEKRGSHLLSINSFDEKLWIAFIAMNHVSRTWTSGNDLTTEGNFTWHDGSDMNNTILPWRKGPFEAYYTIYRYKCVTLDPQLSQIHPMGCEEYAIAACQYELSGGETECQPKWRELDGMCYIIDDTYNSIPFNRLHSFCRKLAGNSQAYPLVVNTKKVADFIPEIYTLNYGVVWLGMQVGDTVDSWRWQGGSRDKVDFSVFDYRSEPDNGGGAEPENCVAVDNLASAYDSRCDEKMPYICEKDLAPVTALGDKPGSVASLRVMTFVPIGSALAGMLAILWL